MTDQSPESREGQLEVVSLSSALDQATPGTFGCWVLNLPGTALAGVAQWIKCRPANMKVAALIPSQGTCWAARPGPLLGAYERQPQSDVSFPLFLLPFFSLEK